MTRLLVDQWCPEPHEAAIVALAHDPPSRTTATADEEGLIAVFPGGAGAPSRTFQHGAAVRALAVSRRGSLVAAGDDHGTLAVYRVTDGQPVFMNQRHGESGAGRAMRAVVFSPDARSIASLAVDGRLRIDTIDRGQRLVTFDDFAEPALDWDPTGVWLVALKSSGQPVLVDLARRQHIGFPPIPGRILGARFAGDGRHLVLLSDTAITLVDVVELEVKGVRTADRSSGMLGLALSPDGSLFGVLTSRSIHYFQISTLEPKGKQRHTAQHPTGALLWDHHGVVVADASGRLFRPEGLPPLPATVSVAGRGGWRLAAHDNQVAVWRDNTRVRVFVPKVVDVDAQGQRIQRPMEDGERILEMACDQDGRILAILPDGMPLHVYNLQEGRLMFDAPGTAESPRIEVGLGVVACMVERGLKWYDLRNNKTYELEWVRDFALTGGGSWLAAVTPKGRVRVLDPTTGNDAIPPLEPFGESNIKLVSFAYRRTELLALDEEGILWLYDLAPAARAQGRGEAYSIAGFQDLEIDALWGLSDGKRAVVRVQEPDSGSATLVTLDLDTGNILHEVTGLLPFVQVDPATGLALEPARGNALLERSLDGAEFGVLRSLPQGEWISFDAKVVRAQSAGARTLIEGSSPVG